MIPESIEAVLRDPSEENVSALLEDEAAAFLVDWREDDDAIPEYCERILGTGSLSAEVVNIDEDPGYEIYISYAGKRSKVPLMIGPEDRHITLLALNRILAPEYEVRFCVDSDGGDTLSFAPLPSADWVALESKYGDRVARYFARIHESPNLFTG